MQEKRCSNNVFFLLRGATDSRYNAAHWFRYLRKFYFNDKIKLSAEDIDLLIGSDQLTMFQKVSLKQAAIPNSRTANYIIKLNQKASTPMLDKIRRTNHDS